MATAHLGHAHGENGVPGIAGLDELRLLEPEAALRRRDAHEEGAWVREAAAAYAVKQSARTQSARSEEMAAS